MYTEVPKLRRCCFCLPLRRGILTWGYIHLVASMMLAALGVFVFLYYRGDPNYLPYILYFLYNLSTSILLIVGAHKKCPKLLNYFYICAIVSISALAIMTITETLMDLYSWRISLVKRPYLFWYLIDTAIIGTLYFILLLYVAVAVRNEAKKLQQGHHFSFVNQAADAEARCSLNITTDIAVGTA